MFETKTNAEVETGLRYFLLYWRSFTPALNSSFMSENARTFLPSVHIARLDKKNMKRSIFWEGRGPEKDGGPRIRQPEREKWGPVSVFPGSAFLQREKAVAFPLFLLPHFSFYCRFGIFLTAAHALAFTTRLPVVAARSFISFRLQDGCSNKKILNKKTRGLNFMRKLLVSLPFWRGSNFAATMAYSRSSEQRTSLAEVQWCVTCFLLFFLGFAWLFFPPIRN